MMITNISSLGQIRGIYVYGNSRYNEKGESAILPVDKVSSVAGLDENQDEVKVAVTYQSDEESKVSEDTVAFKEKESLAESYKDQDVAQYNLSNPYELARMSIENSLLSGMHVDMLA